jgi:hypothetical protein
MAKKTKRVTKKSGSKAKRRRGKKVGDIGPRLKAGGR